MDNYHSFDFCAHCGKPLTKTQRRTGGLYCSPQCASAARSSAVSTREMTVQRHYDSHATRPQSEWNTVW